MTILSRFNRGIPVSITQGRGSYNDIEQQFDRILGSFNSLLPQTFSTTSLDTLTIQPSIDIIEDKDSFKVEVEMPGVGEEDIKVSITDGRLTIKGEKSTSKQDKSKNYLMREIGYGYYERNIALPDYADIDKAKASFKKGMLWVVIPKKADSAKRSRDLVIEEIKK